MRLEILFGILNWWCSIKHTLIVTFTIHVLINSAKLYFKITWYFYCIGFGCAMILKMIMIMRIIKNKRLERMLAPLEEMKIIYLKQIQPSTMKIMLMRLSVKTLYT